MTDRTPTGQLVNRDGSLMTSGKSGPPAGERPGVTIRVKEDPSMAKADKDGVYQFGKSRIKVRKGAVIPAGATPVEERKKGPAPENRAEGAAPENRSKRTTKKDDD